MKNYLMILALLSIAVSCRINSSMKKDSAVKNQDALNSLLANGTHKRDTTALITFLGKKMYNTIQFADSVRLYVVARNDKVNAKKHDFFSSFNILEKTNNLDSLTVKQLKNIVLNTNSFSFNGQVKNCVFTPDVVFRFVRNIDTVDISMCFYCDTWKFKNENNIKFNDSDNVRGEIIKFLTKIFPKNKKLAALRPKKQINTENDLINFFGEQTWQKIKTSKQANAFLLDSQKQPTNTDSTFGDFAVIKKYGKLKQQEFNNISSIVKNPKSYSFDDVINSCVFSPDIGIEFITEENPIRLYISYYCDTWVFDDGKNQYTEDCEAVRSKLVDLAKQLFPDDKIIKKLK